MDSLPSPLAKRKRIVKVPYTSSQTNSSGVQSTSRGRGRGGRGSQRGHLKDTQLLSGLISETSSDEETDVVTSQSRTKSQNRNILRGQRGKRRSIRGHQCGFIDASTSEDEANFVGHLHSAQSTLFSSDNEQELFSLGENLSNQVDNTTASLNDSQADP
jgi:hypothetical protein